MKLAYTNLLPDDWQRDFAIAFSGGSDSLALAHRLRHHKPTLYHFNHKLDERDDEIAKKCQEVADELNLKLIVRESENKFQKGSIEDYCRKERYQWFSTLGATLLMGHHLNDATESYLLNCLKGCPEYLPLPISTQFGSTLVARPLILTPKSKINDYLDKHNLKAKVVEDFLNNDLTRRRNWIRLALLPEIQKQTNLEKVVKKIYLKRHP